MDLRSLNRAASRYRISLASLGFEGRSGSGLCLGISLRRGRQSRKSTSKQTVRSRNGSLTLIPAVTQLVPHASDPLLLLAVAS